MESLGGGVEVAAGGSANEMIAAFPDKSIWSVSRGGNTSRESLYTYCWVDEDNEALQGSKVGVSQPLKLA